MPKIRIRRIFERMKLLRWGQEIPEEETNNKYGDATRKIEVGNLENYGILREFR